MEKSIAPQFGDGLPLAPIGVLVVDDQAAVREGLARLIACAPLALRAIATAGTAAEALSAAARLRPEVVVLDADLAGDDGLVLIAQLAPAAVLVLTCHGDAATRARAMRLGCGAFIEKHQPAAELLGALVRLAIRQMRGEPAPIPHHTGSRVEVVASSDALAPRPS